MAFLKRLHEMHRVTADGRKWFPPGAGSANRPKSCRLGSWLLALSLLTVFDPARTTAASPVSKEYQVKAAFLYNFTKFVEWPSAKFADHQAPIVIGVLGKNPFGTALAEMLKERKVNGREVEFKLVSSVAEIRHLHVLFVAASEASRFEGLETALRENSVLGVGETESFLSQGGAIMFALEDDKLRFEIDMGSAEEASLRISAQLQKLARKVKRK